MLIFRILGLTLMGFWRLFIGIALGTALYIYCFLYRADIYTQVHLLTRQAVDWIASHSYVMDYAKWFELLKIDDKLSFALYVLFGRLLWSVIEIVSVFLYRKMRFG